MSPTVVRHSKQIVEEHKRLRESLSRIQSMVVKPPEASRRSGWLKDLAAELTDLEPRLKAHFEAEEKSGFFDDITESWPGTSDICRRMMGEHESLLKAVSDVCGTAAGPATLDETSFRSLLERAGLLIRDVSRHEERENDLMFRTLEGGPAAQD